MLKIIKSSYQKNLNISYLIPVYFGDFKIITAAGSKFPHFLI